MPQFGLPLVLTPLPMQLVSGAATPSESMPQIIQTIMLGLIGASEPPQRVKGHACFRTIGAEDRPA